ncbi:hypothetical protein Desaci_1693 [Desulfosporosinus acidiphilus SJ4]|uniref:Uncharacterized protein n=1 Tax=Desulfosporosinus acidiphilus (strain DSM 22704 / JCM 16185 / SJ4) TaxID=646529 RepID=I4D4G1_DESAJ|nr:hypothetical protein [Desulfosporosinus acidiphilus]AFM40685.1 hypothetical protein Desaci_1693 [Desulfosporosinus acidiphilus SJ4]
MAEGLGTHIQEPHGSFASEENNSGKTVTLSDIFRSEFMKLYTQYESIEELLTAGGFEVNTEDDYDAIPDEAINAHVAKTTNFRSWKEMLTEAAEDYLNSTKSFSG